MDKGHCEGRVEEEEVNVMVMVLEVLLRRPATEEMAVEVANVGTDEDEKEDGGSVEVNCSIGKLNGPS